MRFCWAQYGFWAVIALLGLMAILHGCGAKGDLFMPEEPPASKVDSPSNDLPTPR